MKIHQLWSICVIIRACLAYIVYRFGNTNKYIWYGLITLLLFIGLPFFYNGYYGSNNETQIARVFWHDARYIHGLLYTTSALYLIAGNVLNSSLLIATDLIFSIIYRIMTDR